MSMNDTLSNAMSKIHSYEAISKKECIIKPLSKVIKAVLDLLNKEGYVGKFTEKTDGKGNFLLLNLIGKINKCGAVKPRHSVSIENFEKFEKRYLPAKNFGVLIVSTSQGVMTHTKAKEKKIGGKLLAYCY